MSEIVEHPSAFRRGHGIVQRHPFPSPVVVWLVPKQHQFGVRRIRDVEEGRAAVFRYGIQDLRHAPSDTFREIWIEASTALVAASRNPEPALIAQARVALVRAAMSAGALASPDELSELSANGWDFAP